LGENHPDAYEIRTYRHRAPEKGRAICFTHGYFAAKDTPIPDIGELAREQPKHLEELLQRAHDESATARTTEAEYASFSGSRAQGSDWDRVAKEFEAGKHKGCSATFTKDGTLLRWIEPETVQQTAQGAAPAIGRTAEKSPSWVEKIPGGKWTAGIVAAAAVGGVGWAIFRKNRKEQNAPGQEPGATR
jgi:hypothetical protein